MGAIDNAGLEAHLQRVERERVRRAGLPTSSARSKICRGRTSGCGASFRLQVRRRASVIEQPRHTDGITHTIL